MSEHLLVKVTGESERIEYARQFCELFLSSTSRRPRVLFGRNVYARDLIQRYAIHGVVDDFSSDSHFEGVPVIRSHQIPTDALVLVLSGGRPLTVKDQMSQLNVTQLDYFAFQKHAGVELRPIVFNEGFSEDFDRNRSRYEWVDSLLADDLSREIFRKLISFRFKADIELLRGFTFREPEQYFEPFLNFQPQGEVFYDVGCFDGYTSQEFIRHCPGYEAVHAFEPESANVQACRHNLANFKNTNVHPFGLSNVSAMLRMSSAGSGSTLCEQGEQSIRVEQLDGLNLPPPTLIKMDIEGAEPLALQGGRKTIIDHHPRIAVAVYHQSLEFAPLWQIPELVLSFRPDYEIRLRHYTESIYETVMFFLPKGNEFKQEFL